jgi:hypothetical protein
MLRLQDTWSQTILSRKKRGREEEYRGGAFIHYREEERRNEKIATT